MQLIVDTDLPRAPAWALEEVRRVLHTRGERPLRHTAADPCLIIGLAGRSKAVDEGLAAAGVRCPEAAESLALQCVAPERLVVAGSDERGLTYALLEVARAVELATPGVSVIDAVRPVVEFPQLTWRSLQLFLCNRTLEGAWFYDEGFWDGYLTRLARCRYNNLSLTFGHQIPYLSPPYPFLVDVPGFGQVRPLDWSAQERRRHLETLAVIAAMARDRGLHFTFGVWSQHAHSYGEPLVEGLTTDILADYNAAGLAQVLAACADIDGVQFRMNVESGVPEEEQAEFYEPQFRAIAGCGRPIRLDVRAKGLADATIELARRLVPDTVVSTKHWCEHLGMPYPMLAIQQADRDNYRRYGTWDLLRKPRAFPLIHRLWSAGSQRVLPWGDPTWVRRFAASCAPSATGFEVMAPLTNKGINDERSPWSVTAGVNGGSHADEHDRYWVFYLLFGRLGYAPDASPEVWRREFRRRFGEAGPAAEEVYRTGSQILPLLTTVLQWSASLWRFWPERFPGRSLDEDAQVEPSDPTRFYGIDEYVRDARHGRLNGKWTPPHVADHLRQLAAATHRALADLEGPAPPSANPELARTRADFTIAAHLAEYHAHRMLAATQLSLWRVAGEPGRLLAAHRRLVRARDEWAALSATAGVYEDDLVFGRPQAGHSGHWRDDLEVVERDLADVARLIAERDGVPASEAPPFPGGDAHPESPAINFEPPAHAKAGHELQLRLRPGGDQGLSGARCFYRIAHQAQPFAAAAMRADGDDYAVTIPGDAVVAEWDLVVFFELCLAGGAATRWPDWRRTTPYFVMHTR